MRKRLRLEQNPNNSDACKSRDIEQKFFEKEGSTRALTSGSLAMIFALLGSSCVWIFLIIATDWEGLQYFGLTGAINGILGTFSIGFSRYFIAEIKESSVLNKELARLKAASYSKILLIIGLIIGSITISISFLTDNYLLKICYFASGCATIFGYFVNVGWIGLEVRNRYDIIAFLSIFGGIFLVIIGYLFIRFNWNPIYFAFHPFFNISTYVLLAYFFHKHAPFSFRDILRASIRSKTMKKKAPEGVRDLIRKDQIGFFMKNSLFSMVSNLESIGIFGNLLVYFAALYLAIFNPAFQSIGVSLLTILMMYGAVKTVILYYSAPLNIEISEACAKNKHHTVEGCVNNAIRISSMLALAFLLGMLALSSMILLSLHGSFFIRNGEFDQELFMLAIWLFVLISVGEFCYGYSTLFANALIGSGNGRQAAIGFGITFLIIIGVSPICIYVFGILGVGITMVISVAFLLPYMLIQLKRKLHIKYSLKILRLIPNLIIIYLFFSFASANALVWLPLFLVGGALLYMTLNPFFGISEHQDFEIIRDLTKTLKMKPLGTVIVKILIFMYNISPFNKEKMVLQNNL